MQMQLKTHHYFYLFISFLFLLLISVEFSSKGMFMDGLFYADISRNMSLGLGSFWKPHLTNNLFNVFYEHPPLAFGLQSLFFKIFGDYLYVERLYSILTYILVGYLIVLIWENLTKDKKTGWIPLFFWIITGNVAWAAANNMLENTMSIFVCLAVLFYFKSAQKNRFLWITLSALSLSLGLLTKGFFCLYIWGLPFFIWAFKQNKSLLQTSTDTIVLVLVTTLPIAVLYFSSAEAQNYMLTYFTKQVMGSIENVQTVDTRFAIVQGFFGSILAPLLFAFLILLVARKMKMPKSFIRMNIREFLMFCTIALSGVIPIMISLKQRNFYILTVYPLFAIGLAYCLLPTIKELTSTIVFKSKSFKALQKITISIILISTSLFFYQTNRMELDNDLIYDSKIIINEIGKDNTINICQELRTNYSLHGYFSRFGNVSLESSPKNVCQYYLSFGDCNKETLETNYDLISLKTRKYKLYKIKNDQTTVPNSGLPSKTE